MQHSDIASQKKNPLHFFFFAKEDKAQIPLPPTDKDRR